MDADTKNIDALLKMVAYPAARQAMEDGEKYEKLFKESHRSEHAEKAVQCYSSAVNSPAPPPNANEKLAAMLNIIDRCHCVETALKVFESGQKLSPIQMYYLGRNACDGLLRHKNPKQGMLWIWDAAQHGCPEAQFDLGEYYFNYRRRDEEHMKETVNLFHSAAEQGHVQAQRKLGYLYETGRYVTKDNEEAKKWYSLAAQNGDSFANTRLQILNRRENSYFSGGIFDEQ